MEATGRGGGRGPSWSYRRHEETGSSSSYPISSSSRSGTIVSTAYPSGGTGSASRHSSSSISISMESAMLQQLDMDLELRVGTPCIEVEADRKEETGEKLEDIRMKNIESRVREFFSASSENRMVGLERWFDELDVSWVLKPYFDAASWKLSWIRGLIRIIDAIHLTKSHTNQPPTHLAYQFALFFQEAMSKMLHFVDFIFSTPLSLSDILFLMPEDTSSFSFSLFDGLVIHDALSLASSRIRFHYSPPPPAEVETIEKEMVSLLSAKQGKAFEAIWSALQEIRTRALKSMEEYSSGAQTLQESSDIHKATYSVMHYICFLLRYESRITPLVSQAVSLGKYVPHTGLGDAPALPFFSLMALITEMPSLQEFLFTKSEFFSDQGLRFLFLLNNSNYIRQHLRDVLDFTGYINVDVRAVITHKVEQYTESYIKIAWEPVLECLFNPTPLCLVRKNSPLSKFESEFQKIYTTQTLCKVPDPELRKRLRETIIEKIIPAYTKYIEDSKVTNPKFTPEELEEKLQELFEG